MALLWELVVVELIRNHMILPADLAHLDIHVHPLHLSQFNVQKELILKMVIFHVQHVPQEHIQVQKANLLVLLAHQAINVPIQLLIQYHALQVHILTHLEMDV